MFEMGSTIVLLFEAPEGTKVEVKDGDRVLLGQELVNTKPLQFKNAAW